MRHEWFDLDLAAIHRERGRLMRWFLRIVWVYMIVQGALLLALACLGVYALFAR